MRTLLFVFLGLMLALSHGCASVPGKSGEPEAEPKREDPSTDRAGLTLPDPSLDGVFVAPGVDFSRYQRLLVTDLDLSHWQSQATTESLVYLNRDQRQFLREEYTQALVHYLVADGSYPLSLEPEAGVLRLDTRIQQGLQRLRPNPQQPAEPFVVMLIQMELYDAGSGQFLASLTDRRAVGRLTDQAKPRLAERQIARSFSDWMEWLREQLDQLRTLSQPGACAEASCLGSDTTRG